MAFADIRLNPSNQANQTVAVSIDMFYLKYLFNNLLLAMQLIREGQWRRVFAAIYARVYLRVWSGIFLLRRSGLASANPSPPNLRLSVQTDHPVAINSPDHLVPHGTKYNNSTNRKFVLLMNRLFRQRFPTGPLACMDLGCSGGQLIADFASIRWIAVGIEGSDYSLKHQRANWRTLAGTNLFTSDITKPFQVRLGTEKLKFHLITAWEVMEHIEKNDLEAVFDNIRSHLAEGGFFIASTSSSTGVVNGLELHQTRMKNSEWRAFIAARYPDLEAADLGLKIHQYVRFDYGEASFLVYRKRAADMQPRVERHSASA